VNKPRSSPKCPVCNQSLIANMSTQNHEDTWWEHPSFENGPTIKIFDYMLDGEEAVPKAELFGVFKIFHAELEKHSAYSRKVVPLDQ